MIILLMGIADLICALGILAIHFDLNFLGLNLIIFMIAYLAGKSFLFRGDLASILDGVCAFYIFLMVMGFKSIFMWFFFLYILQKALLSFKI